MGKKYLFFFFLNRSSNYAPWFYYLAILTIFQASWLSCLKLLKLSHIPTTFAVVKERFEIPFLLPFLSFG